MILNKNENCLRADDLILIFKFIQYPKILLLNRIISASFHFVLFCISFGIFWNSLANKYYINESVSRTKHWPSSNLNGSYEKKSTNIKAIVIESMAPTNWSANNNETARKMTPVFKILKRACAHAQTSNLE